MKNRLQFNRIPTLFTSGETMLSGTSIAISGREKATDALKSYVTRRDFIPLIGEPIVVRYIDDKGKKQAMLAIGKATGSTSADTYGVEYHIIDTAKLTEDVDLANENAAEALDLASAATKDVADYLVILKNMIISGVGLTDGTYFDNNGRWDRDPSQVGLYKPYDSSNYLEEANSFRDADFILDEELAKTVAALLELSGATESFSGTTEEYFKNIVAAAGLNDGSFGTYPGHEETHYITSAESLNNADILLDEAIWNLSANTIALVDELSAGTIQLSADTVASIAELSAGTIQLSADTHNTIQELSAATEANKELIEKVIESAGLEEDGSYPHAHDANFIDDAVSLNDADVILDRTLGELSANTVAVVDELSAGTIQLSADTVAAINKLSAGTVSTFEELSGVTEAFSAATDTLINNIISGAGLNPDGTFNHTHEYTYLDDSYSLAQNDEILDRTLAELSANTMAADEALNDKIDELSANTMAADQALQDQIDELDGREVLGVSAITVERLENGDSKVSLLINEEDDKVLTQNTLGLKANVSLVYSRDDKKIYLKGKNGIVISEIDADDFIKDGMLSAASVIVATQEDHEQYPELIVGKTYIKLLFNVDGEVPGRANPVFISAEDLVDIYTVAPESYTYMAINDYVISLNVDQENGLASYDYARNISAVTANIVSACGLNMGDQGGYPGHDETHYIKNAGSLDQADVLLDAAIYGVEGDVAELSGSVAYDETIINNILVGTGLNTQDPGEYHGHDDTHYIKDATSLDNADVLLDDAVWSVSGMVYGLSAATIQLSADTDATIHQLSAGTIQLSADTYNAIQQLSAGTLQLSADTDAAINALSHDVDERIVSAFSSYSGVVENYVQEAIEGLSGSVEEYVVSAFSLYSGVVETYVQEALSGLDLDEVYEYIDNSVESLSGSILEYVQENEEVTAAALNDLNDRLNNLNLDGDNITILNFELPDAGGEELLVNNEDNVTEAFGKLQKQILDNEEAIAAGFNDLNDRVNDLNDRVNELSDELEHNTGVTILSGVVASFSSATYNTFVEVGNTLNDMGDDIQELSGVVESISAKTSGVLTINVNGEEQGVYSPSANTTVDLEIIQEVTGADVLLTGYEISTATSEEQLVVVATDNVNEAFGKIQKQIYDNEAVIAGALNDLHDAIDMLSSGAVFDLQALSGSVVALSAGSVNNFNELSGSVESLSAKMLADELVIAAALNDLNGRVLECFNDVVYNSTAKTIEFYNGDVLKDSIDATAFIKDGMLDNVSVIEISGEKYLSFVFNTDAGKETINIKISDFASLYTAGSGISISNTDEISLKLANKGDSNYIKLDGDGLYLSGISGIDERVEILSAVVIDDELVIAAAFNDLNEKVLALSANSMDPSNYYTKDEVDAKITSGGTFDPTQYYNKTEVNNIVSSITIVQSASTTVSAYTSSSSYTSYSAYTSSSSYTSDNADKLSHNIAIMIAGEVEGSASTNFQQTAVTINTAKKFVEKAPSTTAVTTDDTFLNVIKVAGNTARINVTTPASILSGQVIERHILIRNTGSTNIAVTASTSITSTYSTNGNTVSIPAGGVGEINVLFTNNGTGTEAYIITS